ncbi:hypothetical protein B0J12DRAFT_457401 [Macrophomina phaseolina]|uniref:Uncharacterized protein n=1 Tax=Macrophomina phaseolina TaxID=35725 RepID=A0ABQ8GG35_9PEZI|nr:hypothetical protein B0J12DRAFT_457401 [Macrophomina phaseolina]
MLPPVAALPPRQWSMEQLLLSREPRRHRTRSLVSVPGVLFLQSLPCFRRLRKDHASRCARVDQPPCPLRLPVARRACGQIAWRSRQASCPAPPRWGAEQGKRAGQALSFEPPAPPDTNPIDREKEIIKTKKGKKKKINRSTSSRGQGSSAPLVPSPAAPMRPLMHAD